MTTQPYLESEAKAIAEFLDAFALLLASQGDPDGPPAAPGRASIGLAELHAARRAFAALPSPIVSAGLLTRAATNTVSRERFVRECAARGFDPADSLADLRAGRTLRIGARDYWIEAARAAMRTHLANSRERLRKSDPDNH